MTIKEHLLALAVVLIWGFNFVVIRWGIEDVHPMTMTLLRFFIDGYSYGVFYKKAGYSYALCHDIWRIIWCWGLGCGQCRHLFGYACGNGITFITNESFSNRVSGGHGF